MALLAGLAGPDSRAGSDLPSATEAATVLTYPHAESANDRRYDYDWAVLRMAMEKTRAGFGPYALRQGDVQMTPARVTAELLANDSPINILVRATSVDLERRFLPVRIPVDRGLIGYRVFLARRDDLPKLAAVRTLDDLRAFSIGLGSSWGQSAMFRQAGLNVVEGNSYEGLFGMLQSGRFDLLSRPPDEAIVEYDQRGGPGWLALEPNLLLQFPIARYFFLRRDAEGQQLAKRIEAGMEIMIRDGSLLALFHQYKDALIKRAALGRRQVLRIANPTLPPETPLARRELWLQPSELK